MLRKSSLLLLIFLFALAIAGCASPAAPQDATQTPLPTAVLATPTAAAQAVTLTDGLGRTVMLTLPAQRIVSLAPSNTEILYALGAGAQVVGRDEFSDFPTEAQAVANIGGGFGEINTESLVALKPDLVLAADIIAPENIQAIEKLGITVYALPNPTTFDGLYTNLQTVGQITGHETQAAILVDDLQKRVKAVEDKLAGVEEKPLVFYVLDTTDPNAPYTTGPGTFIDLLISKAGGQNLGASLENAWAQISLESLVAQDPDIILLGNYTWGGVKPEDVATWAGWDALTAVKEGHVYTFDDNLVSRPGPRMVDGLEAMARQFHPDLFK